MKHTTLLSSLRLSVMTYMGIVIVGLSMNEGREEVQMLRVGIDIALSELSLS